MYNTKMDWNFGSNGCYNQANALVAAANILSIPALAAIATTYPLPSFAHLATQQQQQQQINNEHSNNNNNNSSSINNNNNNSSSNNFANVLQQLPFNTTRILNNNENANKSVKNVSNELLNNNKIENSSSASYNNNNNNNNYDDKYSDCDSNYGMIDYFLCLILIFSLILFNFLRF
jgi:hypothetical protein